MNQHATISSILYDSRLDPKSEVGFSGECICIQFASHDMNATRIFVGPNKKVAPMNQLALESEREYKLASVLEYPNAWPADDGNGERRLC